MKRNIFAVALVIFILSFSAIAFAGANFQLAPSYELTSPANYQIRLRGRSWNANNMNEITGIHVYIGGGVGAGGQMIGEFRTDQSHNFDATLTVPQNRSGNQLVVIYAVNGIESKELDRRNINILPNNQRANFQLTPSYELTSPANYQIRLRGRSWNASNMNEITGIHVYIGGGVGAGGQMIGEFRTDQSHNFDTTLTVPQNRSGNQLVVIYAVNGIESKELDRRNINILPNNENWNSKVGQRIDTTGSEYRSPMNNFSQGQCTWYAWGRMKQVTGKSITFNGSATAKLWKDNAINCSQVDLQSQCIAVRIHGGWNKAHTYENGHVAFVEHVDGNNVYYSESNWSSATDRTIKKATIAEFKNLYAYFIK